MKRKMKILLLAVLLLAAVLRFYQVTEYPAGVNADEAAYAYNAYSLAQTGKGEQGEVWPAHLISFADYKPVGTAYILLPLVKIFGLNEGVLRFPSALAGVISVAVLFFLIKKLFANELFALVSAFFLAISPWHIHFSRGAWETNLATTFMLVGLWLFLKGLENPKYFLLSILNFSFSMYTYHSPRVVIPLLGLFLIFFYRKQLLKRLKWIAISAALGLVLITPLVVSFTGPAGSARFSGVSIFSDIGPLWWVNRARGEHFNPQAVYSRLFHNRPVIYALRFSQNYFNHFDGVFLFILGDNIKRSNGPDMGEMYLFDFAFLLAGFYFLFRKRPKNWQLPIAWLILAPIPAALTFQTPNALRAHNMIIPLVVISAYGFYNLLEFLKKSSPKLLFTVYCLLFIVFINWNVSYFLHQYFVHYSQKYPEAWEYGFKELVAFLEPIKDDYQKIYITEQYDQPYIIFLFYMRYPPEKFQKEVVLTPRDKFGFSTVRDFDNFHFENIDWGALAGHGNSLVCGTDEEIPDNAKIIRTVFFRNGKPAFQCAKI